MNLLFNKTYYAEIDRIFGNYKDTDEKSFSNCLERHNKTIYNTVFDHDRDYRSSLISSENGIREQNGEKFGIFLLKTAYPGLLIGSGNPHGSHQSDNDINLGFSFDYVSGQPYIPGSSVKGVLRSKFKHYPDAMAEIVETTLEIKLGENKSAFVSALETDIFDGNDVFLDAVVYDGEPVNGRLMGADYITPHSSSIKNPIPVLFIKVLPGVRFEFRFKLSDSEINGIKFTAENKKKLFEELLKYFGVGAKTNVGYGIFEECDGDVFSKTPLREIAQPKEIHTPRTTSSSSEFKKCELCGARIYKKRLDGSDNRDWKFNACFKCRKVLRK